jgi:hypothetical protein
MEIKENQLLIEKTEEYLKKKNSLQFFYSI